ncbi:MAG: BTAD domain-containing putative transcriptional regulator [Chloroflexota bacterium]
MQSLTIRLFGYPQLIAGRRRIQVMCRKTLAMMAYLAWHSQGSAARGCESASLAAMFWPGLPPVQAMRALRRALGNFSRAGGKGWLVKSERMLALNAKMDVWVDAVAFENTLASWKTMESSTSDALHLLEAAAGLVRGDFLAGLTLPGCPAFHEWQVLQSERLRLHFGQILEALARLHAAQKNDFSAIQYARYWLEIDPLNEAAHRLLMVLYESSSQSAAALQQYETCRHLLKEKLDVDPEAETLALSRRIRRTRTEIALPAAQPTAPAPLPTVLPVLSPAIPRPTGLVTFLFTDIEGSTRLWEHYPQTMPHAHGRQEAIIRQVMAAYGGYVYKMIGDAFQVAFSDASMALAAAAEAQRQLQSENWGEVGSLKVRMALHVCATEERPDDYLGPELNRVARIMSAGYGGQVLLSRAVYERACDRGLPENIALRDLDEWFLKDLVQPEHLYQLVVPGLTSNFPPIKAAGPRPNLPMPNTPFIGRQAELDQIERLLQDPGCRLISLVGIGGTGKTRLALQVARQSRAYEGRAYFVGLAAITTPEDVTLAIAEATRFSFRSSPNTGLALHDAQMQLLNYLADKKLLLVLDNFEQLIGCATFLTEVLEAAPGIKLLVTSRERLNLPAEWVIDVAGLAFPVCDVHESISQYDAVQMFVRVAERSGRFSVTEDDWLAIARICQLLQGMPLGIEMAAFWTKMLSCSEIADEIARNLDFLTVTWRGMPERHQTLRLVFDYSWRFLSEAEQAAFCKLAVFQSGFTREAALEVVGASLALLTTLGDKSFLRRVSSGRFDIHPVLKQYAGEKLAESASLFAEVRFRHALYYTEWFIRMFGMLKGNEQCAVEQRIVLGELRVEAKNLSLARQVLLERADFERLERILPGMILFDVMNDQQLETREMTSWLLALKDRLQSEGKNTAGFCSASLYALTLAALHRQTADLRSPEHNFYRRDSLQLAETLPDNENKAFTYLVNCVGPGIDPAQGLVLCRQCVEIFERMEDLWGIALSQLILADIVNFGRIDADLARGVYQASMAIFERIQNDWGQTLCYTGLTFLEYQSGRFDEAYRLGQHSVEMLVRLGNFQRLLEIRRMLGEIAVGREDFVDARQHFRFNLAYSLQIGDQAGSEYYMACLARMGK